VPAALDFSLRKLQHAQDYEGCPCYATLAAPSCGDCLLERLRSKSARPTQTFTKRLATFSSDRPVSANDLALDDKLTVQNLPLSPVKVNSKSRLTFRCHHDNVTEHCPSAYRVTFIGPTIHTPRWESSHTRINARTVAVDFILRDPGTYLVYAWPEHDSCDQWVDMELPWNTLTVAGAPFELLVTGPGRF
jgi:hypothetical protein